MALYYLELAGPCRWGSMWCCWWEWRIWSCQARPSQLSRPSLAGPSLLVRPSLLARPSLLLARPSPPDKTFPDMFTDKTISEKQYPQLRRNNMQSILSPTTSINARPNIMSPVKTAVPIKTVPFPSTIPVRRPAA